MTIPFAARFPVLFHVTDRVALPGIARHGLMSAERLCAWLGADGDLGANRLAWRSLETPLGRAALRRQGMPDAALRSRLDPAIDVAEWRRFISAHAFLCVRRTDAQHLMRAEPGRDQAVIAFPTAALIAAGCALRFCAFNNGHIDRSAPDRRRLRSFGDYRPIAAWVPGTPIREISIHGGIPPSIAFGPAS